MENLHDYSVFVTSAYLVSGLLLTALALITVRKYFLAKSPKKNEKSA